MGASLSDAGGGASNPDLHVELDRRCPVADQFKMGVAKMTPFLVRHEARRDSGCLRFLDNAPFASVPSKPAELQPYTTEYPSYARICGVVTMSCESVDRLG